MSEVAAPARVRPYSPDDGFVGVVRRHGPAVLLGVVVGIAVLSGIGAVIVAVDRIDAWDLDVIQWFVDHRTARLDTLTGWGTWLAETIPVATLTLLAMIAAWFRWRRWAAPLFVAAAVGGEKLIYFVTSLIVARDRPPVETVGDTYATRSFPSGHVASAVTLYGSIALLVGLLVARHWRTVLFVVVAVIASVVGFCRMYRGFHYPTDVLAGAVLGICWLAFVWHRLRPELVDDDADTEWSRPRAATPTS